MKFKNKQKIVETPLPVATPPVNTLTESQLQDHLKNLQTKLAEAQTKAVMIQGAVQMVELQIREMNNPTDKTPETKNGVN